MQLIESAYEQSRDGRTPDFYHAEQMLGASERASGAAISATLERETAERLKDKAEITKQLRKAKESLNNEDNRQNNPRNPKHPKKVTGAEGSGGT